jgi:putative transposase
MKKRIKAGLVCDAVTMAFRQQRPGAGLIMLTDRGSQYAVEDIEALSPGVIDPSTVNPPFAKG